VTGGNGRNLRRILGGSIAAPDHVQIGAHQNEIAFVDVPRACVAGLDHRHRRAARAKRILQSARIYLGAAEPQDGVTVRDTVLDRSAVVEPDMRQPRAGHVVG